MNNFMKSISALLISVSAAGVWASDGITVNHLGQNSTIVRVKGEKKYLLLPVQESNPETPVNVLVNGKIDRTINVKLAKTRVDYTVPFDLSPYEGNDVILDITSPLSRSSVRDAQNEVCWENLKIVETPNLENREKFRPLFHHTPVYGWMNDPNGMFYKDGKWHLYYQWNPFGSKWQNLSWGHSSSADLIHWEAEPIALEPDGLGMIFSGSSVVDHNNTAGFGKDAVISYYTSCAATQQQSMAYSNDNGATLNKYHANPVITLDSEARDPNMFWDAKHNQWVLLIAHALDHEMLIFTSPNLKDWTLQSSFGRGLGQQNGVWECPDLMEITVDGSNDSKWLLICNINPGSPQGGSGIQYFTGMFDGKKFIPDTNPDGSVDTKWLDYGKDNYALVTWSNAPENRRTAIGWMSNWQYAPDVPTMQFRSANTLPRELGLFTGEDGKTYAYAKAAPEVLALRDKPVVNVRKISLSKKAKNFQLPVANDGVCEIVANVDARNAAEVVLSLSNDLGDVVKILFNPADNTVTVDRTKSGIVDFSQEFPAVTTGPTFSDSNSIDLRIFVDRSSIELFANGEKLSMTNLVFPNKPYTTLSLSSEKGSAAVSDLKVYSLKL